jgi:hypothetical protein
MNYIKHLNNLFLMIADDQRLSPFHVSLYYALFQLWNINRFRNPVSVCRGELMQLSKIGSANTYTRCLKELHQWGYIIYEPSYNPHKGSLVKLYSFEHPPDKGTAKASAKATAKAAVKVLPPSTNNTKPSNTKNNPESKIPPELNTVFVFFQENDFPPTEAEKFFNHFQSNGWKVGGKTPMQNWHAAAKNWMLNATKFNTHEKPKTENSAGKLHSPNNKNYQQPL